MRKDLVKVFSFLHLGSALTSIQPLRGWGLGGSMSLGCAEGFSVAPLRGAGVGLGMRIMPDGFARLRGGGGHARTTQLTLNTQNCGGHTRTTKLKRNAQNAGGVQHPCRPRGGRCRGPFSRTTPEGSNKTRRAPKVMLAQHKECRRSRPHNKPQAQRTERRRRSTLMPAAWRPVKKVCLSLRPRRGRIKHEEYQGPGSHNTT